MPAAPFEPAAIHTYPSRRLWDAVSTELLRDVVEHWSLTIESTYNGGFAASVSAVRRADGSSAVLKLGFPHAEAIGEALALEAWPAGSGPRLLAQDPWRWAMLLERVRPGRPMSVADDADSPLTAACGLLCRLWSSAVPTGIPQLTAVVGGYVGRARERTDGQRALLRALGADSLIEDALSDADDLLDTAPAAGAESIGLLHGDFNPGNILRSDASGHGAWMAIDPKPMYGDRSFDLGPLVGQLGLPFRRGDPAAFLATRLREAADLTGCDIARSARWAVVRAAFSVCWYAAEGERGFAAEAVAELAGWVGARAILAG